MTKQLRMAAIALVGAIGLSLGAPTAAHASKSGKRNTALALGAVAAYGLIKKKPLIAGLAGAGAVYSWIQSNKEDDHKRRDRNRRRNRLYQSGYYDGARSRPVYYAPSYASPYRSGYSSRPYGYSSYGGRSYNSYGRYNSGYHGRGVGHAYGRRCR